MGTSLNLFLNSAGQVRVRFAPSPTGNLHVGGARTALFNYLYACNTGGKMVLRVEDTDQARSTKESEAAVLRDLAWLGIKWDEGPDIGGEHGPYRQSERTALYKQYVDTLVEQGKAYPCFCTDEELQQMKADAETKSLPPIYRGKWASASQDEVQQELAKGTPYCYRFRVPSDQEILIPDRIRGDVRFNTNALGDFVILRSNGLPVYNFCVAVDDALMRITHVIRAEEHLPNTLRQVLIYEALGFSIPTFGHVSLILAPDKSKLSKRHGATSVGEFREQGFLPEAMVNYLSLLGWNDGTEQELFSAEELQQKFSLERITKSAAVFDKTKLSWMNGQYLRALPDEEVISIASSLWTESGLLAKSDSAFVHRAVSILKNSLELIVDADTQLRELLDYPLEASIANDEKVAAVLEDNFAEVANAVVAAFDSGELPAALAEGADAYKGWMKALGKAQKRKGKRLFMPLRVALTGTSHGPDVGEVLGLLTLEDGDVKEAGAYVPLSQRVEALRGWLAKQS
ncbi:non-discriminatory gln-glu-trna synthetase [Coccomyxa subellipsoidea C-169]|uniref:glutamate--tRNA ligase n=1 Tax=Coccomyxa subellipsoidea (strain C-169) TaxID=574566 RepID=I0Z7L4_COCSC|nr:non-discriminatory gln-glu-trna synthetase [Coccomyxa subellipsoidea C-169]EIE26633.1 non-discriminatory gln-glu-trna synthetase [Coccomyxa subellipsoidea C-169]|eukprot:XP_005651177.1 non-discriminatory gln-glu-trna synthetase [Coccomyxa subellipsoidea C-169]